MYRYGQTEPEIQLALARRLTIGIGGVSRSGKSTLAMKLKNCFEERGYSTKAFDLDGFVKGATDIPQINGLPDWEHPDSVNWIRLIDGVNASEVDVILIEGLFIFSEEAKRLNFDLTIRIEIDRNTFLQRRKNETRWGSEPAWFLDHVWDAYQKNNAGVEADIFEENLDDEKSERIIERVLKIFD